MKKKILAVVLAVATAFSMFGASLSAAAADPAAAWTNDYTAAVALGTFTEPTDDAGITTLATAAATELAKINAVGPTGKIYAIDYDSARFSAYVSALTTAAGLTTSNTSNATELANAKAAYLALNNAKTLPTAMAPIMGVYGATGERAAVLAQYGALYATVQKLNASDYEDGTIYTAASIDALKTAFTAVDANAATPTSVLQYRINAYTAITSNLKIADTAAGLTALATSVDAANLILANRGDYAATAAVDAKFAALSSKLDAAIAVLYSSTATVSGLTAAKTALDNAIAALNYDKVAGDKSALELLYKEAKAYNDDASAVKPATWTAPYNKAVEIVVTNKYLSYTQSEINDAYNKLAAQIALVVVVEAPASSKLLLQEAIEKAQKLVESDYYPSTWTAFAKAVDAAVAVAAREKITSTAIAAAITAIETAQGKLVAKSVSLYELNTLINSCDPNTGLLSAKNQEGKTVAQVAALDKAVKAATAAKTISGANPVILQSKIDAAVASLKAAIEAYKTGKAPEAFEGWTYDKATGWSYLKDGKAVTGWMWDADYNAWFFMNDNGSMKTGWHWDATYGAWYYLNANGTMATNRWINDNGTWYYVYESGKMAVNTTINGYTVNASGAWVA